MRDGIIQGTAATCVHSGIWQHDGVRGKKIVGNFVLSDIPGVQDDTISYSPTRDLFAHALLGPIKRATNDEDATITFCEVRSRF
jgi:hypothetical protein